MGRENFGKERGSYIAGMVRVPWGSTIFDLWWWRAEVFFLVYGNLSR